jgi:hypothetical protein
VKKKKSSYFSIEYFIGTFVIGLIFFKILEEVISTVEVVEGSIVLRVHNEGSAETGNTL